MIAQNHLVLGQHNGIELVKADYEGDLYEVYYNKALNKTAIGVKQLARIFNCSPQTIENLLKKS